MFKRLFIILLVIFYSGFAFGDFDSGTSMSRFPGGIWVGAESDDASVTPGDDDMYIKGTLEVDGATRLDGTVTVTSGLARAQIAQDNLAVYTIPFGAVMAADGAALTAAESEDSGDHYLSYSSGALLLMGNSPAQDTQTDVSLFQFPLPPEYVDGETVTIRLYAEYTSIDGSGGTNSIDISCYEYSATDGSASGGTDLCSTSAGTLSSDGSIFDFTITPTNLAAGDILMGVLTTAWQDADSSVGEPQINAIQVLADVKG